MLFLPLVVGVCGLGAPADSAAGPRLEACRLRLDGVVVEAEGEVRLGRGGCLLRATSLRLSPEGISAEYLELLRDGATLLEAHRLVWGKGEGELRWVEARLLGCGASMPLTLTARRATLSTARLHLRWPVLRLGGAPIMALPYLALPRHTGVSGLDLPRVAYSGRDGLRVHQGVFLGLGSQTDLEAALLLIQGRGWGAMADVQHFADGRLVGRTWTRVQRDGDDWLVATRGRLDLAGQHWLVFVSPEIVSGRRVYQVIGGKTARIHAPLAWTHLRLAARRGPLEARLEGELIQAIAGVDEPELATAAVGSLEIGLAPTPLFGGLALVGGVGVHGASRPSWAAEGSQMVPWRQGHSPIWGWRLAPGLELARGVGPLRLRVAGRYVQRGTYKPAAASMAGAELQAEQLVLFGLDAALVLSREYLAGLQHEVELVAGGFGGISQGRLERLVAGWWATRPRHLGMVALRNLLWRRRRSAPLFDGGVRLLYGDELLVLSDMRLSLGRVLSVESVGVVDVREGEVPLWDARACLRWGGAQLCAAYLRQRAEALWTKGVADGMGYEAVSRAGLPWAVDLDGFRGSVGWRGRRGGLGAHLVFDPLRSEVSGGGAELHLGGICGALAFSLGVDYRAGQRWPDIFAMAKLDGQPWAQCL